MSGFFSSFNSNNYLCVTTTFTVLFDVILVGVVPVFIFVRPVSNNNNDNDDDVVNDVRTDTLNHIGLSIGAPYSSLE